MGLRPVVFKLRVWLRTINSARRDAREEIEQAAVFGDARPQIHEDTPQEIWRAFCTTLREGLDRVEGHSEDVAAVLRKFLDKAEKY